MEREPAVGFREAVGEHITNPTTPREAGEILFVPCQTCRHWSQEERLEKTELGEQCPDCDGSGLSGEEYPVAPCETRICGQFEAWVQTEARRGWIGVLDPEEASAMRSAYLADLGARHYMWEGRHIRSALADIPGIRHMLYLLLRRCDPRMTQERAYDIFDRAIVRASECVAWALGKLRPRTGRTTTRPGMMTESSGRETSGLNDTLPTTEKRPRQTTTAQRQTPPTLDG